MKKRILPLTLFLLTFNIQASYQLGKVKDLWIRASDGLIYFHLDTALPSDKPACARQSYWIIKDENSETGKKQYALLLSAKISGRQIRVYGFDACTRWSDGEDVNALNWF